MKPCRIGSLLLLSLSGMTLGCSTMSNTEKGIGLGAAGGAGLGTAIGAIAGSPEIGAVAGGLLGTAVGGTIGADADAREGERIRQAEFDYAVAQQQQTALTLDDIIQMSQPSAGNPTPMSDGLIIEMIQNSSTRFDLRPSDISYLHTNGVSDDVIRAMMRSRSNVAIAPVQYVPRPQRERVVVVEECLPPPIIYHHGCGPHWDYCPPPQQVGVGFHFGH